MFDGASFFTSGFFMTSVLITVEKPIIWQNSGYKNEGKKNDKKSYRFRERPQSDS